MANAVCACCSFVGFYFILFLNCFFKLKIFLFFCSFVICYSVMSLGEILSNEHIHFHGSKYSWPAMLLSKRVVTDL